MKYEKYIKNRELFENKVRELSAEEGCWIQEAKEGIRSFNLFFKLWSFDKKPQVGCTTYNAAKHKTTFYVIQGVPCRKIYKFRDKSMFDKFEGLYENTLKKLLSN